MALSMALTKEESTGVIIDCQSAYCKVHYYEGTKDSVNATIFVYKDQNARETNKSPIEVRLYAFAPDMTDQKNILAQIYEHLKNLPEFIEAIDA